MGRGLKIGEGGGCNEEGVPKMRGIAKIWGGVSQKTGGGVPKIEGGAKKWGGRGPKCGEGPQNGGGGGLKGGALV